MVFLSTTWGIFHHIHLKINYIYPPHFDGSYNVNFKMTISTFKSIFNLKEGEVAEWSKANDSKSFNRKLFVGSNPTLSVKS